MDILDPTAPAPVIRSALPARLPTLAGLTVAVVNNRWKSMDHIAQRIRAHLVSQFGAKEVRIETVPLNGGAPAAVLDAVAGSSQLAFVGLAN